MNEKRTAISLSYDDALPVHYQHVAPLLEEHGFRGTFYTPIQSDLRLHPEEWKAIASRGHELGNHTIFHPCRNSAEEPRTWVNDRYNLCNYSLEHFKSELEVANFALQLIDGKTERTYGNTCCDLTVGPDDAKVPILPVLQEMFVAARGEVNDASSIEKPDLYNVGCDSSDGRSLDELISLVDDAIEGKKWLIFMFHGVGEGTHNLFVDEKVHRDFIAYLSQAKDLRVDTVLNVARSFIQ